MSKQFERSSSNSLFRAEVAEYQRKRAMGRPIDLRPIAFVWSLPCFFAAVLLAYAVASTEYAPSIDAQVIARPAGSRWSVVVDRRSSEHRCFASLVRSDLLIFSAEGLRRMELEVVDFGPERACGPATCPTLEVIPRGPAVSMGRTDGENAEFTGVAELPHCRLIFD